MACAHENFESTVKVARMCIEDGMPPSYYAADITIRCAECLMPFTFLGPDTGVNWAKPMVSVDRQELRAPIHPADGTVPFPPKIKGFTVKGIPQ